jgi:hypothetical protein
MALRIVKDHRRSRNFRGLNGFPACADGVARTRILPEGISESFGLLLVQVAVGVAGSLFRHVLT